MTGRHRRPTTTPGRHRAPRSRPQARRIATGATAVLGATTLTVPLGAGAAVAAPPGPGAAPEAAPAPATLDAGHHRKSRGRRVVEAASEHYGKPYQWGGEGPLTFDCSGLTKYVYNEFGVDLPHSSAAQYQVVDHVPKSDIRLGDLVFVYDEGGIYHVGIYAGGDQMWAATKTGDIVRRQEIWTDSYVVGRP